MVPAPAVASPVRLAATSCVTPFGDANATHAALLRGESALRAVPVLGTLGGDPVPLALLPGRALDETAPPAWIAPLRLLLAPIIADGWGSPRRPVFVTSSNFGVGNLHAFRQQSGTGVSPVISESGMGILPMDRSASAPHPAASHLAFGAPALCVDWLRRDFGWGENITIFSHACVSAHLGLLQASRVLAAGLADTALVFSFDFLSPFVAGGFHALKILNAGFPAPYADRPTGSIGLGDGAAYAVLTRDRGDFALTAQNLFNELHHFTANQPDGAGFAACLAPLAAAAAGRRVWLKGHGTGTLEAGRLEATALSAAFPGAPLVGWKGALGHTLGSCGLVELALAITSLRTGRAPGTVGTTGPTFSPTVALAPLDLAAFDAVLCASNAFGGAHAAWILAHA